MGAIPIKTGTGYLLPSQAGNGGKYLTTDGSALAWGTPSGGGGISGSGTTNYLSKWTSGTALGNSLVYDNGTNVGIGTAAPGSLLDIRSGFITTGTASSTSGSILMQGHYTNGALTTFGTMYSSGGPVIGYAVTPSTTIDGAFLSATGIAISRGAYYIRGGTHIWYSGNTQTISIGGSVTMAEAMRLTENGNLIVNYASDNGTKFQVNGGIYGKGITSDSDGGVGNAIYAHNQVLSGSTNNALVQLDTTWNTTGNANAIELNVTNTASGSTSKLMNLKVDLTSMFSVSKAGAIQTAPPTGYTAEPWKLGDATSGTITPDYYIKVEIDGQIYSIPALLGVP